MVYFVVIVLSYLIGTVNPAHLITKRKKKIDIRDVNSKNAGTSNVAMTLGLRWGIVVGFLDLFKGFIPVLIVRLMFPDNDILWALSGLSAIIGHIYPLHMRFKGGKGTATFGGVCFALFPLVTSGLFILFFVVLIASDYIVVPTVLAVIFIPIGMWFTNFSKISIGIIAIYSILSIYKHFPNIVRLLKREEVGLREGLSKK
jgi:glycerol-3-phosphate acyltransferase PlsY